MAAGGGERGQKKKQELHGKRGRQSSPPGRDLGKGFLASPAPLAARQEPHNARALPDNASSINPKIPRPGAHGDAPAPFPRPNPLFVLRRSWERIVPTFQKAAAAWGLEVPRDGTGSREQGSVPRNSAFYLQLLPRKTQGRNTRMNPGKRAPSGEEPPPLCLAPFAAPRGKSEEEGTCSKCWEFSRCSQL